MADDPTISDLRELRLNSDEWLTFLRGANTFEEGEYQSMVESHRDDLDMLVLAGLLERVCIGDKILGPWLDQWDFTPTGDEIAAYLKMPMERFGLEKVLAIIAHDENS
jgi:hypothetical protein